MNLCIDWHFMFEEFVNDNYSVIFVHAFVKKSER